jgi:SAM-dependent methyltransferase
MPAEVSKGPCFLRSEKSAAFTKYCERVYGKALNQYGTADQEQLDLLLRVLRLNPKSRVLDAGCGTGHTTLYLAERSGAIFTGIDKSETAICRANELAAARSSHVAFDVADMDMLELPPNSFDAVIAIEALYFPKDLGRTLAAFRSALHPEGQMGLFYTHFGQAPDGAADTKLATQLVENGLAYEAHDLTNPDRRFWERSKQVASELRAEFAAEGNEDLLHLGETEAVLELIAKGGHRRFLYHVRMGR